MKQVRITHASTATKVDDEFYFNHPEGSFKDFEVVEIIPIDSEGTEIGASEKRTVIEVGQPNEKGISQFKAFIKA